MCALVSRGEEEEEEGDSVTGTKVRVKYGRGKTQKIYEANIKKTESDEGEALYLVHYYGWNVRYGSSSRPVPILPSSQINGKWHRLKENILMSL